MKPCSRNRQLLVWMSLDALDAPAVRHLQAHLESCPGCRQYWQEVTAVSGDLLRAAAASPAVATGEFFHRRLEQRIAAASRPAFGRTLESLIRRIRWPWRPSAAVAVAVVMIVIGVAWFGKRRPEVGPLPIEVATATPPDRSLAVEPRPPTLANYRAVANTSLEAFDDLVDRLAARQSRVPGEPVYSALRRSDREK